MFTQARTTNVTKLLLNPSLPPNNTHRDDTSDINVLPYYNPLCYWPNPYSCYK